MKLSERYRPQKLTELIGQPDAVRVLAGFCRNPSPDCWMFEGPPGTGKTSAALALAHELGADPLMDVHEITCSELGVDTVRDLMRQMGFVPCGRWHVAILEELERLSPQCQVKLKTALERDLPKRAIVIATSNDPTALQPALIQRFKALQFPGGPQFATQAVDHVTAVWTRESGGRPLPPGLSRWGYTTGSRGSDRFSLRSAMDRLEMELLAERGAA